MLYRVTIFRPSQYERGFEAAESWVCGNLKTAKMSALSKLPPAYETYYSAKVSRLPFALVSRKGDEWPTKPVAEVSTPIRYVPSVGDLGYTP